MARSGTVFVRCVKSILDVRTTWVRGYSHTQTHRHTSTHTHTHTNRCAASLTHSKLAKYLDPPGSSCSCLSSLSVHTHTHTHTHIYSHRTCRAIHTHTQTRHGPLKHTNTQTNARHGPNTQIHSECTLSASLIATHAVLMTDRHSLSEWPNPS